MKKGFTLIELLLIIAIVGIVTIVALTRHTKISSEGDESTRDAVVNAVRGGIERHRIDSAAKNGGTGTYPDRLDPLPDNTACSESSPCFGVVIPNPVTDGSWHKKDGNNYACTVGRDIYVYTYNQAAGTFDKQ